MELSTLNQWLQDHEMWVEPKFGHCKLLAEKWVLTSSMHPFKWFPSHQDDPDDNIDQLLRRISVLYYHTETHPQAGAVFVTQHSLHGEPIYIVETRRQARESESDQGESDQAWCSRLRDMEEAK